MDVLNCGPGATLHIRAFKKPQVADFWVDSLTNLQCQIRAVVRDRSPAPFCRNPALIRRSHAPLKILESLRRETPTHPPTLMTPPPLPSSLHKHTNTNKCEEKQQQQQSLTDTDTRLKRKAP
ncbi:hypothetical protein WMY93_031068 [Mugilogobius chulae]|uniref:Uncharacterized protein n=1 Tax=Mugilogobius chulae TaxID=88201 RepID=A0AAW0MNS3_9GOBI